MVRLPSDCTAMNLGCGISVADGWVNIDNSPNARMAKYPGVRWILRRLRLISEHHYRVPWPRNVVIHDLRKGIPAAQDTVDYIYCSHFLEHLLPDEAMRLLNEMYRVLVPGGLVRIVVPDLEWGVQRYIASMEDPEKSDLAADELLSFFNLGKPGHRASHLWMYDWPSLQSKLRAASLEDVRKRDFRYSEMPDIEMLDVRPDTSLHVEARKPTL